MRNFAFCFLFSFGFSMAQLPDFPKDKDKQQNIEFVKNQENSSSTAENIKNSQEDEIAETIETFELLLSTLTSQNVGLGRKEYEDIFHNVFENFKEEVKTPEFKEAISKSKSGKK
ncbi:MAG: hypothetical protein IJ730_03530 [Alphaproteobacteria bacterium]|nr:hypothetical protein [Alphaproteobacteria bacterium]